MKEPIEPSDIREGDRVMAVSHGMETTFTVDHVDQGRLYAQPGNVDHISTAFLRDRDNEWFLLDRPKPAVVLPTEPTLGWADGEIRVWRADDRMLRSVGSPAILREHVTAFTPATAVPTEALEVLREYRKTLDWDCAAPAVRRIDAVLAAVDAANGATS